MPLNNLPDMSVELTKLRDAVQLLQYYEAERISRQLKMGARMPIAMCEQNLQSILDACYAVAERIEEVTK